jgi:hypothetical protein
MGRAGLAGHAGLVGHTDLAGQLSSQVEFCLGFHFRFVLFFFTDLRLDSKFHISRMVDPNEVVPILWCS